MSKRLRVGELRQQSALADKDTRVVIVYTQRLRERLKQARCAFLMDAVCTAAYPDTVDENGNWGCSFKIGVDCAD